MAHKYKNNNIFKNMLKKQRTSIPYDKKLQLNDIKRICKYINLDIFDSTECCIWTGYITNQNNSLKGTYINFYFNKKKVALHRLLYHNFMDDITDEEYLKFSCKNKGVCCNINHFSKFKYNKKNDEVNKEKNIINNKKNITIINNKNEDEESKKKLFLKFD
jgi:hypothetical protein